MGEKPTEAEDAAARSGYRDHAAGECWCGSTHTAAEASNLNSSKSNLYRQGGPGDAAGIAVSDEGAPGKK